MSVCDGTISPYHQLSNQTIGLDCVIQNFLYFLKTQGNSNTTLICRKKSSRNFPKTSSSIESYLSYRKSIHNTLAEINANMSNLIIDGCKGIDSICIKVRECISEIGNVTSPKTAMIEMPYVNKIEQKPQEEHSNSPAIEESNSEHKISQHEPSPKQSSSENKLLAAKLARKIQKRNSLLEEFRETIIDNINKDDFEMMEKIVESINEEIEYLTNDAGSQTAIEAVTTKEHKSTETKIEILKSIEELPTTESRCINEAANFCEEHLSLEKLPLCYDNTLIPEVYIKPGTTDINKKLVFQLEANDSFVCFQRLMSKNKKKNRRIKSKAEVFDNAHQTPYTSSHDTISKSWSIESCRSLRKTRKTSKKSPSKINNLDSSPTKSQSTVMKTDDRRLKSIFGKPDLRKKYSDSLWFSEKHLLKVKSCVNERKTHDETRGDGHGIVKKPSRKHVKKKRPKTHNGNKSTPKNSISSFHSDKIADDFSKCSTGCPCTVSINNDSPSIPNAKCRLRWMRARTEQAPSRKLQFLDILDDLTPKDLLPIQSEYPRKDKCTTNPNVEETYLYKLLYGNQNKDGVWDHLLQPSIECSDKHCMTCNNKKCKKEDAGRKESAVDVKLFPREKALEKLSPYLQAPENEKRYPQFMTILPVKVFYERNSFKANEKSTNENASKPSPTHPQNVLTMKETKGLNRARWCPPGLPKPMKIVYDSVQKKSENHRLVLPQTLSNVTPIIKLTVNSARQQDEKIVLKKKLSKSFSPKGFAPFCAAEEPRKITKQQSIIPPNKKPDKCIKIQSEIERKSKDIQNKSLMGLERKMWVNKYGKGVGQQLVNFIKNQPNHPTIPIPKYAVAAYRNVEPTKEDKQIVPRVSFRNTTRHKQMLAHLKGLKEKNDVIQNNIQKAINVIEAKMIDILSTPRESSSIEAFDVMEKEITNVLSMMKFGSRASLRKTPPLSIEEEEKPEALEADFNSISDQLFKKLEKILDSEKSKGATSTSDSDRRAAKKKETGNADKKHKSPSPKRSTTLEKYCSPSGTSTSLEDDKQATFHSIKRSNQSKGRIGKKSKLGKETLENVSKKIATTNEHIIENMSAEERFIEREYATGENFGVEKVDKHTDQQQKLATPECDEADNSRGDCIKQDFVESIEDLSAKLEEKVDKLLDEIHAKIDIQEKESQVNVFDENVKEETEKETGVIEKAYVITAEPEADENKSKEADEEVMIMEDKETVHENPSPALAETESEDTDTSMTGEVNKIIKRVEDIYSHLDDIHSSDDDHIPVFRDTYEISDVGSQQFLTPFMQAVKDNRTKPESPTKQALRRSPSYYNVLSFLDTLSHIQQEKPIEVQTAWLCYYCQLYHLPEIYYQAKLEFRSSLKETEKPSCLKKPSDEGKSKHKKVSFLVMKENKSCQAVMCPFHKIKALKVSSQQFPPMQNTASDNSEWNEENYSEAKTMCSKDHSGGAEKRIIVLCDRRHQSDHSSEINQVSETNSIKDICEETRKTDNSDFDKSTQVYCQMQTQEADKVSAEAEEETYSEKSTQGSEVSDRSEESLSAANKPPQIQVFYNQSDEGIPKLVVENEAIDGVYGHQAILQMKNSALSDLKTHPNIVVFREVLDTSGILKPLKSLERVSDTVIIKDDLLQEKRQNHEMIKIKTGKKIANVREDAENNEMLLKSFYALVYILMFTALNLEYRCQ